MMTFPNADQAIANRRQAYNEIAIRGRRPVDTSFPVQRANIPVEFTAPVQTNPYTEIGFEPTVEVPEMGNGNPYMDMSRDSNTSYGNKDTNTTRDTNTTSSYLENLAKVESSDNWTAHNKGSGAYGKFQFIPSTEKAYAKKLGMSTKEARTPAGQMAMVKAFTEDNRKGLIRAGIDPTQENLYLSHQQGLGGAIKMIRGGKAKAINLKSNGVSDYSSWRAKFAPRFSGY